MGTILIDKLLHVVVKRKASDLHIAVGQPPVLRLDGLMKRLDTKVLEPEDTVALMKSIAPERARKSFRRRAARTSALPSATFAASASHYSSKRAMWGWSCVKSPPGS